MNYIRGAVNAISAPYQYYKELPPINPSTLTGAIDVIVIQRPTPDGGSELVCSPFHVRFGKWQVLRPGEKKVNVSVNGHPIPFSMKIGEAGEAFFVFETDSDVPEDLITSPILQPTEISGPVDRPGPMSDNDLSDSRQIATSDKQVLEPEFLDLDAVPSQPPIDEPPVAEPQPSPPRTPTIDSHIPSATPSSLFSQQETQIDRPHGRFNEILNQWKAEHPLPDLKYDDGESEHLDQVHLNQFLLFWKNRCGTRC